MTPSEYFKMPVIGRIIVRSPIDGDDTVTEYDEQGATDTEPEVHLVIAIEKALNLKDRELER